jgi:hypothetical protein
MGPQNNRQPLTVFAIGKYWARPLRSGSRHVRTHPMGYPKNLSKKGFCGAFSLKKRPLRPQALLTVKSLADDLRDGFSCGHFAYSVCQ